MTLTMKARELRWRAAGHYSRPFAGDWLEPLRGAHGLEVGGPTALFRTGGLWPVYPVLAALDGVQTPAGHGLWHGDLREGPYDMGEAGLTGHLWLRDAHDLGDLPDGGYGAVLSSHVIEHLANPLGTLRGWLRVLAYGGYLVTVLPHKEGCADHRRPTTTLAHLLEDEAAGTGEEDLTHAEEAIALHDLARDPAAGTPADHRERTLANAERRAMHHHVFTTQAALAMLDELGVEILRVAARWPHDIYVLARKPAAGAPRPDNGALLGANPNWVRSSPFRADRRGA